MTGNRSALNRAAVGLGAFVLLLALSGCQAPDLGSGGSGNGGGADDEGNRTPIPTASEPGTPQGEDEGVDDSSGAVGKSGTETANYVVVGDARYGAESVQCTTNDGGLEVVGQVTSFSANDGSSAGGDSIQIGGVFGVGSSEDPPDTVFVLFDAGDGGQWTASTKVKGYSVGSLSIVSYGIGDGAKGDAQFAFHKRGSGVPEHTAPGEFLFEC